MKIKLWGVRGSIPSPLRPDQVEAKIRQAIRTIFESPDVDTGDLEAILARVGELPPLVRGTAGGNTSCVEIQAGGEILIVDAGSGLRELGLELMKGPCGHGQGTLHLFISHLHWDHIQGFPLFVPAFIPGNRIFIYGIHDLQTALERQQSPLNWPASLSNTPAEIEFVSLQVGQPFSVGQVRVNTIQNTHPGDSFAYRFEDRHSVFVYASDTEYKQLDDASVQPHVEFFRNADALIFDAQYTLREGWQKEDWGHSSAMIGVDLARAAGVKNLILFHHDPSYSDAQLREIQATAIAYQSQDRTGPACQVIVAYEGLTLDLTPPGAVALQFSPDDATAILTPSSVFDERGVDQLARQLTHLAGRDSLASPIVDLSQVETLTTASLKLLIALHQERKGALIVLAAPSTSVHQMIELSGYQDYFAIYPSVEAALAAVQAREALSLPSPMVKDRYQVQDKIGKSRLGVVLKASDTHLDRTVALKILSPAFSEETISQFMRHARQITNLAHRNIVKVFAWDEHRGYAFGVEEFISGPTLHEKLLLADSDVSLSAGAGLDIAIEIAHALEYAHSRGVIHGNLKPQNVFLTGDGVKVSGFGLGLLEKGRDLLKAPWLFLTASYLAPEQILGHPIDARTDLYALGVILYQLFTGRPPFEGTDQQVIQAHLRKAPYPPRQLNPHISVSLEHLILKLLAQNPNDRYANAQQVKRILSGLIVSAEDVTRQRRRLLVGRQEQARALRACWDEARTGQGQLAFVTGEPGIGKTSLTQQVTAQCHPPVLLIGQCQELEGSPPYHLFSQILRTYFATVPPELSDEKARQLVGDFTRLVPEIRQMVPGLPVPHLLEPEQERLRLMISLTQFIERATQERPWLLVLDDLQWADQSSLELLRYLGRHLPDMAILIIGIYRDAELERGHPLLETLRDLSSHPTYRHFPLGRLDQLEVSQILVNLWQQPVVPAALTERIYQHTGGNPFYVEEVAKGLVDDGLIVMQEGKYRFPALEEIRLPQSAHETVWRRICHLDQDTQALLRQAAVLGQTFKFDDLREMSELSEWQVLEHLSVALERQLVQESPGDTSLHFHHAEIQNVLYEAISPLRRRVLHRQAGQALERHAQSQPERFAEELARHFGEAGELEKALVYSSKAGRQAQSAYANEPALAWYERTLEMLDQLGAEKASQFQSLQLSVHQSLGEVLALVARYDEALEHYASARMMFEAETLNVDQSRQLGDLCHKTAKVHESRGEYDQAVEWLEKGLSYLDENEPCVEIARIYNLSGWVHMHQGKYKKSQPLLERSLDLARTTGLRQAEAASLRSLGVVCWYLGDYAGTTHYFEQSLLIYREIGDRLGEGVALNNLGIASGDRNDLAKANAYFEQALLICREIGDRLGEGRALNNLGDILQRHGDYARAKHYFEQPLIICREIGDRRGEGLALGNLCLLFHHLGDNKAAQEYCQQALLILQEIGNRPNQGYVLTYLGHVLASMGLLAEAADSYRQALTLRRELGELYLTMEPLAGLARVFLAQGDLGQAQTHVEEILNYVETNALDGIEEPFRVYLTCYRVLRANNDPRAQDTLNTAHRLLQEKATQISDEEEVRRSFLKNVAAHREIVNEFANSA